MDQRHQSVLDDMFHLQHATKVLADDFVPPLAEILRRKYGESFEPWLRVINKACELRSQRALMLIFLVGLRTEDDMKEWVCDASKCSRPLTADRRAVFFASLHTLVDKLLTKSFVKPGLSQDDPDADPSAVDQVDEFLKRVHLTLLHDASWYAEGEALPPANGRAAALSPHATRHLTSQHSGGVPAFRRDSGSGSPASTPRLQDRLDPRQRSTPAPDAGPGSPLARRLPAY